MSQLTYDLSQPYEVRDVWQHRVIGTTQNKLVSVVPAHDVLMLRLKPRSGGPAK